MQRLASRVSLGIICTLVTAGCGRSGSASPPEITIKIASGDEAPRKIGRGAYSVEIQVQGFPKSSEATFEAIKPALDSILSQYDACSVFFRVHSPQSEASYDRDADLGTALARGDDPSCQRSSSWIWENHLQGVAAVEDVAVRPSSEVVFGDVPLPEGSRFVRAHDYPAVWGRVYTSNLRPMEIRDFYRKEMIKCGYSEAFLDHETVNFSNGTQYISIEWKPSGGEFWVGKDKH